MKYMSTYHTTTVIYAIVFVLSWNSGFIGAEYGLPYSGTFSLLFWRYLILSCLLLLYLLVMKQFIWRDKATLAHTALVGALAHGVWLSCVLLALEQAVPAGVVALVVALQPLVTGAFSGLIAGERVSVTQWLGLIVGFCGVAIAVGSRMQLDTEVSAFSYILPFGSVIAITIASLLQRRRELLPHLYPSLPITETLFYQSVATMVLLALPAALWEQFSVQWTLPFIATLSWLILGVSVGAYGLMWLLLVRLDATRVASLFYLGPPVTMVMAWFAFGDVPQMADLIGLAVVIVGVLLVQWPTSNQAK